MKHLLLFFIMLVSLVANGQTQSPYYLEITQTLQNYIHGTSYNDPDLIKRAFAEDAQLLLSKKNQEMWLVSPAEYASWFKKSGKNNGRVGEVLSIDVEGDIATAKVEILIPEKSMRYIDMFLLKNLSGNWKVVSKAATSQLAQRNGKRILFIVSNAHFHGNSTLPTGVSFSEIVKAYDTFKNAGYTVDFVSPKGGAIPLAYINTSEKIHKRYLYDSDFMHAIKHTKKPNQIDPANYLAVHYVGGGNAMYGVADNIEIQNITMTIYEEHSGIVSSVCHGTAGIVNLKTKDGDYLVSGKRISGYPDSYENQSRAYFKEFPFLIQKTIEKRGGQFLYSDRNTAHVEVDGRIVTGQNHLSSSLVAKKMIEVLQNK
ncbi:peptidase [Thalassotalea sp. M1531]|uniref:Peptidase n=1 Tax=Thalassotalea algicola TaxID=2716224 RepID=A0A7Y0LEJ1_9GAMM|nr:nuclear transport factor 2 family protein [Thalassotalea algicola]NMP32782.1 peptidase [Thalassotalea algicola]